MENQVKEFFIGILIITLASCSLNKNEPNYSDIKIIGAMKNVMWKGLLGSSISLDTISEKKGLYGIGPESYLTGELLINNGKSYISKVTSDSTMIVEKRFNVSAPFFVYGNVNKWTETELPKTIKSIEELEKFIDKNTLEYKRPFVYRLTGKVSEAIIHIQNLPKGTKVSSPKEAHQGQINYSLKNENVEIIGFFSTEHKGVFTHHDSYLHMHLISKDEQKMGHLDQIEIEKMKLYLPSK